MLTTVTPSFHPHQTRIAGWLAVAVLLHALLLLTPARQGPSPGPAARPLAVVLAKAWPPAQHEPEMDRDLAQTEPAAAPPEQRRVPEAALSSTPGPPSPEEPQATAPVVPGASTPETGSPARAVTAARLLDLASRRGWRLGVESGNRSLGVFTPRPLPENWRSGASTASNLFDGMVLPVETEIVDRWLAADGSHNVVLRTPGGETLCGRAEAWNPMSPLVEHVMMFRTCGGGGERTFEMPQRFRRGAAEPGRG